MASQYSHYKLEQGKGLWQKHIAEIYSTQWDPQTWASELDRDLWTDEPTKKGRDRCFLRSVLHGLETKLPYHDSVVGHILCWLDWIYNHLRDKPLDTSVKAFLHRVNWDSMTPVPAESQLNMMEKVSWAVALILLLPVDTIGPVASWSHCHSWNPKGSFTTMPSLPQRTTPSDCHTKWTLSS